MKVAKGNVKCLIRNSAKVEHEDNECLRGTGKFQIRWRMSKQEMDRGEIMKWRMLINEIDESQIKRYHMPIWKCAQVL